MSWWKGRQMGEVRRRLGRPPLGALKRAGGAVQISRCTALQEVDVEYASHTRMPHELTRIQY